MTPLNDDNRRTKRWTRSRGSGGDAMETLLAAARSTRLFADGDIPTDHMNETTQVQPLVEVVPDDLFDLWRRGPLLLATRAKLPVVELHGRILTLRWYHDVISADVTECYFRIGRPWEMKHNARSARPLLPFGSHDLILIDFPPLYRGFFSAKTRSYNTAPVGYTKASLQNWKRALAPLIGEPSGEPKSPIARFLES